MAFDKCHVVVILSLGLTSNRRWIPLTNQQYSHPCVVLHSAGMDAFSIRRVAFQPM